jgi:hypothetical protein
MNFGISTILKGHKKLIELIRVNKHKTVGFKFPISRGMEIETCALRRAYVFHISGQKVIRGLLQGP